MSPFNLIIFFDLKSHLFPLGYKKLEGNNNNKNKLLVCFYTINIFPIKIEINLSPVNIRFNIVDIFLHISLI